MPAARSKKSKKPTAKKAAASKKEASLAPVEPENVDENAMSTDERELSTLAETAAELVESSEKVVSNAVEVVKDAVENVVEAAEEFVEDMTMTGVESNTGPSASENATPAPESEADNDSSKPKPTLEERKAKLDQLRKKIVSNSCFSLLLALTTVSRLLRHEQIVRCWSKRLPSRKSMQGRLHGWRDSGS